MLVRHGDSPVNGGDCEWFRDRRHAVHRCGIRWGAAGRGRPAVAAAQVTTMETTTNARDAVLERLAERYEQLAIDEQHARLTDDELAADFHKLALLVLSARLAEEDDPQPPEPVADCLACAIAMRRSK